MRTLNQRRRPAKRVPRGRAIFGLYGQFGFGSVVFIQVVAPMRFFERRSAACLPSEKSAALFRRWCSTFSVNLREGNQAGADASVVSSALHQFIDLVVLCNRVA